MRLAGWSSLTLILMVTATPVQGQPSSTVNLSPSKGLVVKRDSTFELRFGFRMQDRVAFSHEAERPIGETAIAWQVRRFRLKFDGFAISPRLTYKVQLGLAASDLNVGDGHSGPSPLLDAVIFYALGPATRIGFGQAKLPGGRQALISSGELELPDRPLANGAFTMDRDLGLFADHRFQLGPQVIRARAAISNGEGRSTVTDGPGLCYTMRVEWLPLGAFTGGGDYEEGDMAHETKPKLSFAAAFSTDRQARRSRAQLGPLFPNGEGRTIDTFFADALLKHNGWAWQSQYSQRLAEGPPLIQDTSAQSTLAVNEGWGFTTQLSRMMNGPWQVVGRYSTYRPGPRVERYFARQEEAAIGCSYYVNAHRIKVQSAFTYTWQNGNAHTHALGPPYGLILQLELGI